MLGINVRVEKMKETVCDPIIKEEQGGKEIEAATPTKYCRWR
jgi:hypothetical protein